MEIEIWDARDPADAARWQAAFDAWPDREVVAHPGYLRLFAAEHDQPLAAHATTRHGFVLYPFLLRPIDAPHLHAVAGPRWDVASPWSSSSGGAFQRAVDDVEAKEFWSAFDDFCRARRVVSEFTRLHVFTEQVLPYPGETTTCLTNVVRDLRTPAEQMWQEFEHKVRKNVNRARRSGVTVEVDETGARLDDFLRIYRDTMRRRRAGSGYLFPRSFFTELIRQLPGQFVFFHALYEGRVVSTELVLCSAGNLYSYLGGTDETAFAVRPNDLLKFEICRWGQQQGRTRFLLGGGYAPDDGIFRYKRSFAPHGLLPYRVGHRVMDRDTYDRLCRAHRAEADRRDPTWQPDPLFFPAYRQQLPPTTSALAVPRIS
ncbi:GNAT family N-acetyltransferase [Micromonospora echinofusca]|uniref:GNAT family N-acetyltransferase n=1 Tax=Micromonospora echinofusca TaxID=47858 RepID=A0ABS3VMP5_MICEH|nr:GNAT family N-acetyltransferase [Micromonospora echinofusca]MBO4205808.1 GNAT family N-acetyltransferase [Micromonospora echinofusca]